MWFYIPAMKKKLIIKIKKAISFKIAIKYLVITNPITNPKYLGMSLTKVVKDLNIENYRTLLWETEEDPEKLGSYIMFMQQKT